MDSRPRYLFLYGTLMPEFAPISLRRYVRRLKYVGRGRIPGRLYDLGDYPAAVPDDSATSRIVGIIYALPADRGRLLAHLDRYEGFDPRAPDRSLFVRHPCRAILDTGAVLDTWVYAYRRSTETAPLIPGGDYRAYRGGAAPRPAPSQRFRL